MTTRQAAAIVTALEPDEGVQVVIFASGTPGLFLNHVDLAQAARFPTLPGAEPVPTWVDLVVRLRKAPFVSIAAIRGRTRGGGNELALAMDLRYASQEQAFFSQPEVGTGIVPGGGGSECACLAWSVVIVRSRPSWAATTTAPRPPSATAGSRAACPTRSSTAS